MSTLTTAQKTVSNAALFRQQFGILHRAAISVVMCRTHEPFRLNEVLRDFAWAEKDLDHRAWSMTVGWARISKERPRDPPQIEGLIEPIAALRKVLTEAGGSGPESGFGPGIYTMFYPNIAIDRNPVFVQWLKEAARALPEVRKRLVLICPPEYQLPVELQTDVTMLDFDLPAHRELSEALTATIGSLKEAIRPQFSEEGRDLILASAAGMTMHEFADTVARALVTHTSSLPNVSAEVIAREVNTVKTEAVRRTDVLEVMPSEDMANVGGLAALKEWVSKRRACFTQEARDFGIDPLKGALLAGPPGTGKSLIAKAVARELGLPLIKFDVSRVFASLVGQSEQRVSAALKMIEAMAPCVVLVDEVDKGLGGAHTGGGDSGVAKRVLGKLLTWLQENDKPVFTIFSANRVTELPSELLRRGRLDEIFSVSVPDMNERREVLEIHLRKRGHDPATVGNLEAAIAKEGYVPAELEAAVKDALIEAFVTKTEVTGELIAKQLEYMVPLSEAFAEDFAAMRTWAEQNARPANGPASGPKVRRRERTPATLHTGSGGRQLSMDG